VLDLSLHITILKKATPIVAVDDNELLRDTQITAVTAKTRAQTHGPPTHVSPILINTGIVPLTSQMLIKIPMRKKRKTAPIPAFAPSIIPACKSWKDIFLTRP